MDPVGNIPYSLAFDKFRRALLLFYDHPNRHPPLQLEKARQLTCIRPFHNLIEYHQHMANHRPEKITLFANVDKIQNWDVNYQALPGQLHKLIVYCQTLYEELLMDNWNGQQQWKTKEVINSKKLDFSLLQAAADLIYDLIDELDGAGGLEDILRADLQQIGELIGKYHRARAELLSEEATEIPH